MSASYVALIRTYLSHNKRTHKGLQIKGYWHALSIIQFHQTTISRGNSFSCVCDNHWEPHNRTKEVMYSNKLKCSCLISPNVSLKEEKLTIAVRCNYNGRFFLRTCCLFSVVSFSPFWLPYDQKDKVRFCYAQFTPMLKYVLELFC